MAILLCSDTDRYSFITDMLQYFLVYSQLFKDLFFKCRHVTSMQLVWMYRVHFLMASRKTVVTPLLMHWSYHSLVLSHQFPLSCWDWVWLVYVLMDLAENVVLPSSPPIARWQLEPTGSWSPCPSPMRSRVKYTPTPGLALAMSPPPSPSRPPSRGQQLFMLQQRRNKARDEGSDFSDTESFHSLPVLSPPASRKVQFQYGGRRGTVAWCDDSAWGYSAWCE